MPLRRIAIPVTLFTLYACVLHAADNSTPPAPTVQIPQDNQENATPPWPDQIGPFDLYSADKRHSLRLGLTVQLLFRIDNKDMGQGKARETIAYGEARRIRPTLRGSIADGLLEFYLHLNTSPNTLDLLDYYINYKPHPYAQLRVGQWKIPFTRYRIQSYKRLTFADWAIVSKSFGAERQVGAVIHSGQEKPQAIDYAFGIFSGMNARSNHALGIADLYGEKIISSSNLAEPGPKMEFHPEFVGHIGYLYRDINVSRDTDFKGGPFRFYLGASATYDLNAEQETDFTARFSPEFLIKAFGFSLFVNAYLGWAERSMVDNNPELAMTGGLIQASYLFIKRVELAARYSVVHNLKDFRNDAYDRANALIKAADSQDEADALTSQYKKTGQTIMEHEGTFGINVYIIGESLKWQNDISYLVHDIIGPNKEDVRFRSQLQLSF